MFDRKTSFVSCVNNFQDKSPPKIQRSLSFQKSNLPKSPKLARRSSFASSYDHKRHSNHDLIHPGRRSVLRPLNEDKLLVHSFQDESSKAEDVKDPPLKVFSKKFSNNRESNTKESSSTCQAIRSAVATLYNIDDFNMEKIGEGFFSEVFKVVHKTNAKVMVLKRNKHRANRNAMLKEVQLMNTLSHENILRYEGACVADGQLHALVEYVDGGNLEQYIINENDSSVDLPWDNRVSIAKDVANGLAYLHSKGIFHRDLTSKNILIQNTARPKGLVADFGLAEKIPDLESGVRLSQVGSPYWMSPECLKGQFYNHKSDVFSFGIILCEIIARIRADPDVLPRTEVFGVDYLKFSSLVSPSCPEQFLRIAFLCVSVDPSVRPEFDHLHSLLEEIRTPKDPDDVAPSPRKFHSRSCCSQTTPKFSPSEYARHHTPKIRKETLSPSLIGKEMSQLDPYYIPSPNPDGINPFSSLPIKLRGKIFDSNDLFCSCFEVLEEPAIPHVDEIRITPVYRKAVSLINTSPSCVTNPN